jgi:hypothetical protein
MNARFARCVPPWVPTEVASTLDPDEFVLCEGSLARDVETLAKKLGVYIAVYHALRPLGSTAVHLCRTYRMAPLRAEDIELLCAAEQQNPCTIFVAYLRPLSCVGC